MKNDRPTVEGLVKQLKEQFPKLTVYTTREVDTETGVEVGDTRTLHIDDSYDDGEESGSPNWSIKLHMVCGWEISTGHEILSVYGYYHGWNQEKHDFERIELPYSFGGDSIFWDCLSEQLNTLYAQLSH